MTLPPRPHADAAMRLNLQVIRCLDRSHQLQLRSEALCRHGERLRNHSDRLRQLLPDRPLEG
jgi:hypothetical protein